MFELIKKEELVDYKATGFHYKHTRTGLEVFHLLNDDAENLFAFGFKTLSESSNGAAHILEHSVLCGSKNYPLKDPFMQLNSQSVKTFLNAMTFPDKTVYPASSMVEADYFNLMSVYGDAVFFPLLDEQIFAQEAHRFELDDDGNVSLQGVVYNEMKGAYSSFENVVGDHFLHAMLDGTSYQWDSGGNPSVIPSLTHEGLKAYHAKYYSPSNCKIFLCGNIPTQKQLDFIEEKFLKNFHDCEKTLLHETELTLFNAPKEKKVFGPLGEDEKESTVLLNWVLGKTNDIELFMEAVIIAEILLGHDGSPLNHALIESKLGEDISPNTGMEGELKYLLFSVGMRGVKEENAQKLKDCILGVLRELAENGIPKENVESAIMTVDFSHREVKRSHGPWSLVLMRRVLRGWLNGTDPFTPLGTREVFASIKEKIANCKDGSYLKGLIKKFFLDNNHQLLLTAIPSEKYDNEVSEKYENIIKSCPFTKEELVQKQKELTAFQQSSDNEEKRALIPHLKPSAFSSTIDRITTEQTTIASIPLFIHNEAVNGIAYVDVGLPVDGLTAESYEFLPFFATALTNSGFNNMDWKEAAAYVAHITGGFGATLFTASTTESAKNEKDNALLGHDWIFVRVKMLVEKVEEGVRLLFDCIKNPIWTDFERLHDLAIEYRNDFQASIVPAGHEYAVSRSARDHNHSKCVDEIWNGLSQLYTSKKLATMEQEELTGILSSIHKTILSSGIVANITVDDASLEVAKKALEENVKGFSPVKVVKDFDDKAFIALTDIPPNGESDTFLTVEKDTKKNIFRYKVQTQVGFAASVLKCSAFGQKDAVYESLFAHWFSNNVMWEQIRTIGGAYGGFTYVDAVEQLFVFASYRDPDSENSLEVFARCLQEYSNILLDTETLERVIAGCYSKEIQPRSPSARGFTGFIRKLYGIKDEDREQKVKTLICATAKDVQEAAKRLASKTGEAKNSVVCSR